MTHSFLFHALPPLRYLQSGIIPPLLGMLANKKNDAHASALAMEILVILAGQPRLFDQLRSAGTIPAVVACLENNPAGAREASAGPNVSLIQSVLIVLASFLRGCSDKKEGKRKKVCPVFSFMCIFGR